MSLQSRRNRIVAMLATLLSLLTFLPALSVATASPAYAELGDVSGGTGDTGGNSGSGGNVYCSRPSLTGGYGGHSDHYLAPFPGCLGEKFVAAIKDCPVGFEVWRFYGTESDPTKYQTVSKVNLPNWCQENRTYRYFLPNPQDSTAQPAGPWAASAFINPYGERVAMAYSNGNCGDPRTSLTCYATTNPPFRYLTHGTDSTSKTCANLQTDQNTLGKYFTGPYMDPTASEYQSGKLVRQGMLALFNRWNLRYGSPVALTAINSANPAPRSADTIAFNDKIDCSSALDFVSTTGSSNKVVMGSCVIPINRPARVYTGDTYAFYNRDYNSKLGSTHYTDEYSNQAASQRTGVYSAWRNAIRSEVNTRPGTVGVDYPTQGYPWPNPFILSKVPAGSRSAAADYAAANAYCFRGESSTISSSTTATKGIVADAVIIKVNAPDVFQVGAAFHPGTVTTSNATLMCGNRVCNHAVNPLDPTLASLTYTLDLKGLNFKKCSSDHAANCDYYIKVPATPNANSQRVTGWFFSGTNPGEKVQVTLTNLSAKQQVYKTTSTDLTTCVPASSVNSFGGSPDCQTVTLTDNIKDGGPRPVPVKADLGNNKIVTVPSSGVVLEKEVIGAVTTGTTY